jgi:hypothetical protein
VWKNGGTFRLRHQNCRQSKCRQSH